MRIQELRSVGGAVFFDDLVRVVRASSPKRR
jgi:hypothetical protein